jgi:hypothetical protein
MDEQLTVPETADEVRDGDAVKRDGQQVKLYSEAALTNRQPPLTNVIPKRALTLLGFLVAGSLAIAAIEALYSRVYVNLPEGLQIPLTALDVGARGSLAAWFSGMTLFTASLLAVLVFTIRRHRLDDYRGRYRIWLWAALVLLIASLDATTGLHAVFYPVLTELTGTPLLGDGTIWGVVVVGVLFGLFLIRMVFEILSARLATCFLVLACSAYVAAAAFKFQPSLSGSDSLSVIVASTTLLAAHFCLLYCVTLYGRHVYMEAQRGIPARESRGKQTEKKKKETTRGTTTKQQRAAASQKKVRIDSAHETRRSSPAVDKQPARQLEEADDPSGAEESGPAISKAERRRLRKQQRRQKRKGVDREA